MHVVEQSFLVAKDGHLSIPAKKLTDMGIAPGNHVMLAFLSTDGNKNDYREFLVSREMQDNTIDDEPQTIRIPIELLNKAGIPAGGDVDIACVEGAILILRSRNLDITELEELLCRLGAANEDLKSFIHDKQIAPNAE